MELKTEDLKDAADESANHTGKALALFQLAIAYVALSLLQLSDADYVLGLGQTLPVLNSTVPTEHYLAIAPVFLLVLHIALLFQWRTLKRKVRLFLDWCAKDFRDRDAEARDAGVPKAVDADEAQELLHPFLLTRSALPGNHDKVLRWSAKLLTFIGLVAVPLMILIAIQVRGLAFHNLKLTTLHQVVVLCDLAALWILMPRPESRDWRRWRYGSLAASAMLVWFVAMDAVIPAASVQQLPGRMNLTDVIRTRRLDLQGVTLQSKAPPGADGKMSPQPMLDMRGQDMRFADLTGAVLIRVDLSGANLTGAVLDRTRFVRSRFGLSAERKDVLDDQAEKRITSFAFARAYKADFRGQDLRRVDLTGIAAEGSRFDAADLRQATLTAASLDGADLRSADLRGGDLRLVSMIDADLRYARLSMADLTGADLRGAQLFRNPLHQTRMTLVDLSYARLEALDEETIGRVREAFDFAIEDRAEARQVWRDLVEQDQVTTQDRIYELPSEDGLWMRYDYLPMPARLTAGTSAATYTALLQGLVADQLRRCPQLLQAFEQRSKSEARLLRNVSAKLETLLASEPLQPPLRLVRSLTDGNDAEVGKSIESTIVLQDGRYAPWRGPDAKSAAPEKPGNLALPPWSQAFLFFLKHQGEGRSAAMTALRAALMTAAKKPDALAYSVLAHSFVGDETGNDAEVLRWVQEEAVSRRADPDTVVAVAFTMQTDWMDRRAVLLSAQDTSPQLNWIVGWAMHDFDRMVAAAKAGYVDAGATIAPVVYMSSESTASDKVEAWTQLARAAYRGHYDGHITLGRILAEQGDYERALYWLKQAANSYEPEALNNLAWILATCPDAAHRNGRIALNLSLRASREAERRADHSLPDHVQLDTLAATYAATGAFDQAAKAQKKALEQLPRAATEERKDYGHRLAQYEKGQAWQDFSGHGVKYAASKRQEKNRQAVSSAQSRPATPAN